MQLAAPRLVPPLQKLEFESTHPTQIQNNQNIAERLSQCDDESRERISDLLHFAKWMSPNLVDVDLFVSSAPILSIEGGADGVQFSISLCHGHFGYSINGSPFITLDPVDSRLGACRKLYVAWTTLIKHLPEGFIIYGPDADPSSPDFAQREAILKGLGFGDSEESGRFGIVRGGKVTPLTGAEFAAMAGEDGVAGLFNQRFMVEEIIWNTGE